MSELDQLLEVQRFDTGADQLRHRLANLPERAELADVAARIEALTVQMAGNSAQRASLGAEQDRLERDIGLARDRIKTIDSAMHSGSVNSPRDLQALQDEIGSLNRRIGLLEDDELAVMERLEPLDRDSTTHDVTLGGLEAEIVRLETAITAAEAELAVELDANQLARHECAEQVPADLLAEYELIRSRSGGVAVAALTGGQCGGCHIRLSSMELDRIRKQPADAMIHCEECGRLLVR